jgi:hypothetical protein
MEFGDIPSREEFERLTLDLLHQGITNSDRMRDELRQPRGLKLKRVTGHWNKTPSDKFVNEHAWVLEDLVVRKIINKAMEKEYRLNTPLLSKEAPKTEVRWVECGELDDLGHGVQFLHDELPREHRQRAVAFLEGFGFLQRRGSNRATVRLMTKCPSSITADHWF